MGSQTGDREPPEFRQPDRRNGCMGCTERQIQALASVGVLVANNFPLTTQRLTRAETVAALARLGSDERRAPDCPAWNNLYSNPDESCH